MRRISQTASHSSVFIFLMALLFTSLVSTSSVDAQAESRKYYFQTGHYIAEPFLSYYESFEDAVFIFGFPITETFIDPLTGYSVQYYQRARFEFHPENQAGQQIVRTALGELVLAQRSLESIDIQDPSCIQEPHWAFPVCHEFATLYTKYGGEAVFGVPLTGIIFENGRIMQYFTYARAEWHPDAQDFATFTLGDLGFSYFTEIKQENGNLLTPLPLLGDNFIQQVSGVEVHAFTQYATTNVNDFQVVHIIVEDQSGLPIAGARVILTIELPDGQSLEFQVVTNDKGLASQLFKVTSTEIGLTEINAFVFYGTAEPAITRTSFTIWY